MRAPPRLILGREKAAKSFGKVEPYVFQFLALHPQRGSCAKVHDTRDRRTRRRRRRIGGQAPRKLVADGRRKMVKQSEVRGHLVALGRKVNAAQFLQPPIVAVAEGGCDDDRGRRRVQIST